MNKQAQQNTLPFILSMPEIRGKSRIAVPTFAKGFASNKGLGSLFNKR